MEPLHEFGFLRLCQVIGRRGVSPEQAAANRMAGKGRQRPCSSIPGLLPLSRAAWYRGMVKGEFPRPIKKGKSALYRVEDIRALIAKIGGAEGGGA